MTSRLKAAAPLLKRTAVFLCLFVLVSGVIGPRIVAGGLMESAGFAVYGGAGKALLFGLLAFGLLVRSKPLPGTVPSWERRNLAWFAAAVLFALGAWLGVGWLLHGSSQMIIILLTHLFLLLCAACLAIGSFGAGTLHFLWGGYKKDILVAAVSAIGFYAFLEIIYGMWQSLSVVLAYGVRSLLQLGGVTAEIVPPMTLLLDKFGVTIERTCSGIESIALFSGLYVLIGLLDWRKLNLRRMLFIFPLALIVLFAVNILRVYGLIIAGYYIDPHLVLGLFHTYAGMLFFIIFSGVFWALSYRWLLRTPAQLVEGRA